MTHNCSLKIRYNLTFPYEMCLTSVHFRRIRSPPVSWWKNSTLWLQLTSRLLCHPLAYPSSPRWWTAAADARPARHQLGIF